MSPGRLFRTFWPKFSASTLVIRVEEMTALYFEDRARFDLLYPNITILVGAQISTRAAVMTSIAERVLSPKGFLWRVDEVVDGDPMLILTGKR